MQKEFYNNRQIIYSYKTLIKMAPWRGFEPPTYRLTAECSTIELPWKMLGGDTQIRTGDEGVAVLYLSHLVMSPLNW